jgi:hypothetical protein
MDWDIERFADKIKPVKMAGNYRSKIKEEVDRMQKMFQPLQSSGVIDEPAVITDKFGRIIIWHLPRILSNSRVVSKLYIFAGYNDKPTTKSRLNTIGLQY